MLKERLFALDKQQEILEALKPKLGKFIQERLYKWGLGFNDIRLVDEAAFGYTGIPIYGPELSRTEQGWNPHIDFGVREDLYKGPRSDQNHPLKILLPSTEYAAISNEFGLDVQDFIKGTPEFFALPTTTVAFGDVTVLIPEPTAHIREFTVETLLFYSLEQVGEKKLQEWFEKLKAIRDVGNHLHKNDVESVAVEMIRLSQERWLDTAKKNSWEWLVV